MNHREDEPAPIAAFDELEADFRRVGRAEPGVRTRRRKWLVGAIAAVIAIGTPAVAVAVISDGDDPDSVAQPVPYPPDSPEGREWAKQQGLEIRPAEDPPAERETTP